MSPRIPRLRHRLAALAIWGLAAGCSQTVWTPRIHPPTDVPPPDQGRVRYLKAHLHSGDMLLLTEWEPVRTGDEALRGTGTRFDAARRPVGTGRFAVPLDSVALLEANRPEAIARVPLTGLAIFTGLMGGVTGVCVADPKSCFGSCPTFYVGEEERERPHAEGFSASIARALEATDVDALPDIPATGREIAVLMRNEALETHAVRHVRLRVVPRPQDGRVFVTAAGAHHPATDLVGPARCEAPEGDCRGPLGALDGVERRSWTDSTDLAARETIELEFRPAADGPVGLVLGARHTLVSTYVFYQTIAHLGTRAGAWLAGLERGGPPVARRAMAMARVLGGIEVEAATDGQPWRRVGAFDEAGPLATDVQVLPLGPGRAGERLRVRLRLAKGAWRLDHVGLARLGDPVDPVVLEPARVERDGVVDPEARGALLDAERYLVTYPGQDYRLVFELPRAAGELSMALESRGYYYEWTREGWLAEEDPVEAALAFADPAAALRRLAGPFKALEPEMERRFWNSRFGRR